MTPLTTRQIERILGQGEGRQVEFKEGVAADGRIARTLCAFANTRGGVLLVGVTDRGRAIGVSRPAAVADRIRELAARAVEPPVRVSVETARIGAASVVHCSVPLSPARPHAVSGGPAGAAETLIRVGSSNRAASKKALAAIGTRASRRPPPATPLEMQILRSLGNERGEVTVADVVRDHGVGKQRARQALERLEHAGRVVAHGLGEDRTYEVP